MKENGFTEDVLRKFFPPELQATVQKESPLPKLKDKIAKRAF